MAETGAGGFPLNSPEEIAARGTGQGGPSVSIRLGAPPAAPADAPQAPLPIPAPTEAAAPAASTTPYDPWADSGSATGETPGAPIDAASAAAPGSLNGSGRVMSPPVAATAPAAPSDPNDPWADMHGGGGGSSTPGEQAGAFLSTATKSAIITQGAITGMRIGAAGGAILGAYFPPLEAATIPIGAVGGLIAGWYLAEKAAAQANLPNPQDLPADQRPLGYFGEMVGSGLGLGGGLNAAANAGTETGIPFIQRIIASAKGKPVAAIIHQTGPAAFAGLLGMGAEEQYPGNAWVRVPLEIAGGALSPGAVVMSAFGRARSVFNYSRSVMGSDAQNNFAAQTLFRAFNVSGEDVNELRAILADPDALGLGLKTAADETNAGLGSVPVSAVLNSPAVARLEKTLTDDSGQFKGQMSNDTKTSLAALKNMIIAMFQGRDPATLSAAAEARAQYFRGVFGATVNGTTQKAIDAAKSITGDTQAAIPELSLRVTNGVNKVLDLVGGVEDEAYSHVDKTIPGDAPNIVKTADDLRGKLMAEDGETLPDLIESFSTRMKTAMEEDNEGAGATTTGELMKFRSRMLALARQASAGPTPNFLAADQYGKMATAAYEDMSAIGDQMPGGEFKTALDTARQITKEKMDVFYRTFVGKAITTGRAGEASIEPEAYLTRALGSGGVMSDVRMQQIQQATEFMGRLAGRDGSPLTIAGPEADEAAASVADAQNRIVRLAAAKTINPLTGRVNPQKLATFINENGNLIDRFPGLRDDLEDAVNTEVTARAAAQGEDAAAAETRVLDTAAAPDSGVTGVSKVITGDNPETGLRSLIDAVKAPEAPAGAVDGLRSAVLQDAMTRATGTDGTLDFSKMDELLNQPMKPGLPSSVSMLRDNGIMADDQAGRLTQILALGQRIQDGVALAAETDVPEALPNIIEALAKVGGSRLGAAITRRLIGGSTLIGQAFFAKLTNSVLRKMQPENLTAVLQNAVRNKQAMADLLARPDTTKEAEEILSRIASYGKIVATGPLDYAREAVAGPRQLNVIPGMATQDEPGHPPAPLPRAGSAAPALIPPAEASTPRSEAAPSPTPAPEAAIEPAKPTGGRALLPLIAKLENSDDDAKSLAGAVGRYQIELGTAKSYDPGATVGKLKTPAYNEEIAGKILDDLFAKYKGNVAQVLANYNASPRATKTFMKTGDPSSLPSETQKYLKRARNMGALE